MRFGIFRLLAALVVGMITVAGDVGTGNAQACRKNYYRCDLNRGRRIDPANPNCCWSPMTGRPSTSCPRNFYKCDLKAGGRVDPEHPAGTSSFVRYWPMAAARTADRKVRSRGY
jgi:hypothetical protein